MDNNVANIAQSNCFSQRFANIHALLANIGKIFMVIFLTLFLGCTTYIKSLPSFPEAKTSNYQNL